MSYDQTYCASPNCINECGRKLSDKHKQELNINGFDRISYAYFCGVNPKDDTKINQHEADVDRCQHEIDYGHKLLNPLQQICKNCGEFYK